MENWVLWPQAYDPSFWGWVYAKKKAISKVWGHYGILSENFLSKNKTIMQIAQRMSQENFFLSTINITAHIKVV